MPSSRASSRGSTARVLLWLAAGLVAGLVLLPIAYLAVRAATGAADAWRVLLRPSTAAALGRTVVLAAGAVLCSVGVGLPLAWLTHATDLPGRRVWRVVLALPMVLPSYVGAYLYVAALGPRGLLQRGAAELAGIERLPSIYGLPGALLAVTAVCYPFVMLTAQSSLQRLDPALLDAARSLGDRPAAAVRRVVLPQLRPAVASGALLVGLYAARDFGAVSIMRYETLARGVFTQYRSAFDRTGAATWSLLLLALVVGILGAERWVGRGASRRAAPPRRVAPLAAVPLGPWRLPALLLCAAVAGIALVLPAGMLAYWLLRGAASGQTLGAGALAAAGGSSVLASGAAAAVTVLAALPVAWLASRRPSPAARIVERAAHLGFALPGVVVALALVHFGIRFLPWAYQTLPLLVAAYVVLLLPEAVGAIGAAIQRVPPRIEESGRTLGRGPWDVARTLTMPLVAPGVGAAAALVFLSAMKELPATLILGPAGFRTLAVAVWSAVGEAYFARAAAPALLLILLASVPTAFLTARRSRHGL